MIMMDEILSTLQAMIRQEERGYAVDGDFLHQEQPQDHPAAVLGERGPLNGTASAPVDAECRCKISTWCYQVSDYAKFTRETVAIAMNLLDRYLMTTVGQSARLDREEYQRAAMTSLYISVKIHETEAMAPKFITKLSRGTFAPSEVVAMEAKMLGALQWRLNPPTSLSFIRMLLDIIPTELLDGKARQTVYEVSKYQGELAVSEYPMVGVKPSTIAFCSLMNAFESVGLFDEDTLNRIERVLSMSIGIDHDVTMKQFERISTIQDYLFKTVIRNPTDDVTFSHSASSHNQHPANSDKKFNKRSSFEVSPRSVSTSR